MNDVRSRTWCTVFYPQSCPDNWISIISNWHIPCFVSPLHDKDINTDGEIKKPHYHLMVMFKSKKSSSQVKLLFDEVSGVGSIAVHDSKAMARYFCHLDNPDKVQYNPADVLEFGGASYAQYIETKADNFKILIEMEQFIVDNDIIYYHEFSNYCRKNRIDWYQALMSTASANHLWRFMRSVEYARCRDNGGDTTTPPHRSKVKGQNDGFKAPDCDIPFDCT